MNDYMFIVVSVAVGSIITTFRAIQPLYTKPLLLTSNSIYLADIYKPHTLAVVFAGDILNLQQLLSTSYYPFSLHTVGVVLSRFELVIRYNRLNYIELS